MIKLCFVVTLILFVALGLQLRNAREEIATLQNTLTASRNSPCNLAKERAPEEMAARKEARKIEEAWAEYKQGGREPCPEWGECRDD